jgi:hypothetical protein
LPIDGLLIDMFSPIDLQRSGLLSAALGNIEPFVRKRAAHAAKHSAIDQVPDGCFHHAPCRRGGKEHRLLCSEECLKTRMNCAVKILKIFTAMPNHWTRKCGPGFVRYFNGTWNEKFVVRNHAKRSMRNAPSASLRRGRRPTFDVQELADNLIGAALRCTRHA